MPPVPERVRIETADGVASVRMTRGDKHNGLDWSMFESLNAALDELGEADDLRAVVLSGEGPSFCAGLDIKSFTEGEGEGTYWRTSLTRTGRPRTSPSASHSAGASSRSP